MTNDKTNLNKAPAGSPSLVCVGDWTALHQQVGSSESLCCFSEESSLRLLGRISSVPELKSFLRAYQSTLLAPIELPAVSRAFQHTSRTEGRELILLDRKLELEEAMKPFAEASKWVGRFHLKSLKPLRGNRVVQKYIQAVENGEANGWNTTVYGLILGVYSFPLRQGLIRYAEQTLAGFISAASEKLKLPAGTILDLQNESAAPIPGLVDSIMGPSSISVLK